MVRKKPFYDNCQIDVGKGLNFCHIFSIPTIYEIRDQFLHDLPWPGGGVGFVLSGWLGLFVIVLKKPGRRKCELCPSSEDVITARTIELILSASNGFVPF